MTSHLFLTIGHPKHIEIRDAVSPSHGMGDLSHTDDTTLFFKVPLVGTPSKE
jgi:hypothetical protein